MSGEKPTEHPDDLAESTDLSDRIRGLESQRDELLAVCQALKTTGETFYRITGKTELANRYGFWPPDLQKMFRQADAAIARAKADIER